MTNPTDEPSSTNPNPSTIHSFVDYSNPYYLQSGDHPRAMLISQLLTDNNFLTWNKSMSMALIVKNKLCFVDGALRKPYESDPMYHAWIRYNTVVLYWLLNALSKEIASSILCIDSAKEM